jgi:hypothetical protein
MQTLASGCNRWSRIEHLSLSDNGISNVGLGAFVEALLADAMPALGYLSLRGNALSGVEAGNLLQPLIAPPATGLQFAGLFELSLEENRALGDDAIKPLADALATRRCRLELLNLIATGISSQALVQLASALPHNASLEELLLARNPGMAPSGMQAFRAAAAEAKQLRCISLPIQLSAASEGLRRWEHARIVWE